MAATFNPALTTPKDQVRQKVGDTNVAAALIQDETIEAYLATKTVIGAAVQLCLDLAARFARVGTVTLDDQQQRGETISKQYLELASRLQREEGTPSPGAASTGAIIVGGVGDYRGPIDPLFPCRAWPY
jgi:hypothetical protein